MAGLWFVHSGDAILENKLHYFLAINTLLLLGFLQLCKVEVMAMLLLYLVPCFLLFAPILLLLTNFLAQPMYGCWIERDELVKLIKDDGFYVRWVAEMFSCVAGSYEYRKRTIRLLHVCIGCIGASLLWLFGLFILAICRSSMCESEIGIMLTIVIMVAGAIVWTLLLGKDKFAYSDNTEKTTKFLRDWLGGGSSD